MGVSTAPRSIPSPAALDAGAMPSAATTAETAETAAVRPPVELGRLHPVTALSTGHSKLDAKVLIARIERQPTVLDTCSGAASAEPDADAQSWKVRLVVSGGNAALRVESPVGPAFAQCLEEAGKRLSLQGVPNGEMLLLLGLTP